MRILEVRTHFDAAHKLEGYDGLCKNLHGHRFEVILKFEFPDNYLDDVGMCIDFKDIKNMAKKILPDHLYLNDIYDFNPTAENISKHLFELFNTENKFLVSVKVFESPDCSCEYRIG